MVLGLAVAEENTFFLFPGVETGGKGTPRTHGKCCSRAVLQVAPDSAFHFLHDGGWAHAERFSNTEEHFQIGIFVPAFKHADIGRGNAEPFAQLFLCEAFFQTYPAKHRPEGIRLFLHIPLLAHCLQKKLGAVLAKKKELGYRHV